MHSPVRNNLNRKTVSRRARVVGVPCVAGWAFRQLILFVSLMVVDLTAATGQVQTTIDIRREYNVKAVNIYGFCRFVTWPDQAFDSAQDDLVIGIFGDTPIESPLTAIAVKKKVQKRRLQVVRCTKTEDASRCHVVFVARSLPAGQRAEILLRNKRSSVVFVGESSGFAEAGGVANFYIRDGRVRFELNAASARDRRLRLDAKLLSLGTVVRTGEQPRPQTGR